jgi:hypothetical protein
MQPRMPGKLIKSCTELTLLVIFLRSLFVSPLAAQGGWRFCGCETVARVQPVGWRFFSIRRVTWRKRAE